jgi:WD40 repeat protein
LDINTGTFDSEPFKGHTGRVNRIAFSPDGTWVVSGSYDKTICVWNTKTWEVVAGPLTEHDGFIFSVAFLPDGARIVSSSIMKSSLHVWDIETGKVASSPFKGFGWCAVFSPDGLHIASSIEHDIIKHDIYLLDATTGEISCGPFEGHNQPVSCIAFLPDGMYIVSGSWDKTIRVWNTKTGGIAFGPFRHTDKINSVAFSPDGTKIVSGSRDKAIRVWDLNPSEADLHTGDQGKYFNSECSYFTFRDTFIESTSTCFKDDAILENGWVLNPPSTLLFWVPPWNCLGLWWPRNSLVIAETPTKLDFRQFVHGTSWSLCHQPTV